MLLEFHGLLSCVSVQFQSGKLPNICGYYFDSIPRLSSIVCEPIVKALGMEFMVPEDVLADHVAVSSGCHIRVGLGFADLCVELISLTAVDLDCTGL